MEQLSSCYFCGGALDVSLAEYPIVPKTLQPDAETQGTVVLCSTCRQKLAAIVEPVVEAAANGGDETPGDVPDEQPASAPDTAASAADTERENGTIDERGSDPLDEGDRESAATDGIVDPTADGTLLGGSDATDEPSGESGVATPSDATSEARTTADAAEESGPDTAAATDTDAASGDSDTTEQGPSLTKLEYNKVMRLLQNREMPVDRAEIREVAVNAYDIESEQFDAIIDAAVERDLIGQERGKLVEAE
ncbi:hypothetical protein ACOZ4I_12890 [Haloarcula salina]|uniref:hypothetical protein n=1 Tax=Haloarcula salina TaxID=1429914 RepID=UPI003C6EAF9C